MIAKLSIRFWDDHEVRALWDDDQSQWWFSVIDSVWALSQERNYTKNRNYRKYLKTKLKKENNQLISVTHQFKILAPDGKRHLTDMLDSDEVIHLAKEFPNSNLSLKPWQTKFTIAKYIWKELIIVTTIKKNHNVATFSFNKNPLNLFKTIYNI